MKEKIGFWQRVIITVVAIVLLSIFIGEVSLIFTIETRSVVFISVNAGVILWAVLVRFFWKK